ncbi:MAG: hypothetical protein B1H05_04575 [Candidatus Cloacimonas sp. 4484_140]|nr:hypothetical protein [Candidatus Cloacimonadota bacterium]OPX24813.1 MAG: hypothetical protein B1H05_04575 [Candidatus Cloacimonas sp. 4484_140]
MKYILRLLVFVVILFITACMVNSPTPSIYAVSPSDSSIFDLDTLTVVDFYLPDFDQEIQFQISDDSLFMAIIYDNVFQNQNYHYLPASFFRENTKYFWRIRGKNSDSGYLNPSFVNHRWSEWSECWCFFII